MSNVKMTEIKNIPANKKWDEFFSVSNAEKARKFHEGIPEYEKTPLACLSDLADHLGVKGIYVKDESWRFGLNAFKGLGGSYAVGKHIQFAHGTKQKKQFHGKKGGNEMRNVILERFKEGKKTIGTLTHMKSMTAVEAIGAAGMDYVMIDMEHSPVTIDEASRLITAADAAGIDAVARSGSAGRTDVLKLLDVGAKGVIVPGIESKEQVEELVRYAKFAPQGARGYCMTRDGKWGFSDEYAGGLGEYMKRANEGTMLIPQCETTGCLEQIEEITAMDGVDGVLIGPYDLSLGMGLGGSFDSPEFNEAVCRIKTACNKNNKVCITFTGDPDQISEKIEQGYDSVLFGLDVLALIGYYKNVVDVFNKCGV